MNILPQDRQVAVISALVEGCSIRTTERLTETHRDTVMRLGARIGRGCAALHDFMFRAIFGDNCHYGQVVKSYVGEPPINAARRYSPGTVVRVAKLRVMGFMPAMLTSTSHVERTNLSVRMSMRRFTRLTNGYSKKVENHEAAVALFVAHYNLCRVHETLRMTPAMALGLTDRPWSIGELIQVADASETHAVN